ncbi:superoxide dismutase family protein [Aurantimonas sp. A2-1-M11]|uniref:superoxide dismutase family protein n=1 Tax=Aurantimonas sp. A2-1-M11 TaxID=3113712 RepID=UPI002F937980
MLRIAALALASSALLAFPAMAQDSTPMPTDKPANAPSDGMKSGMQNNMEPVTVEMKSADGGSAGTVTVTPTPHGLLLKADLTNIADGEHGFHVHETGVCEGDFTSAGGHYNPTDKDHGYMAEGGYHAGDMPNFTATNGAATFETLAPALTLTGGDAPLNDADGSAIMVHGGADDYTSQPSGDAGERVACGVVYSAQ